MAEELQESWAFLTTPPDMVMKLMLLQKREGFIQAAMGLTKSSVLGGSIDSSRTAVWLTALWLETAAILKRDKQDAIEKKIQDSLDPSKTKSLKVDEIVNGHIDAFLSLSDWLDKKGLTKWDTKGGYDTSKLAEVLKKMSK